MLTRMLATWTAWDLTWRVLGLRRRSHHGRRVGRWSSPALRAAAVSRMCPHAIIFAISKDPSLLSSDVIKQPPGLCHPIKQKDEDGDIVEGETMEVNVVDRKEELWQDHD